MHQARARTDRPAVGISALVTTHAPACANQPGWIAPWRTCRYRRLQPHVAPSSLGMILQRADHANHGAILEERQLPGAEVIQQRPERSGRSATWGCRCHAASRSNDMISRTPHMPSIMTSSTNVSSTSESATESVSESWDRTSSPPGSWRECDGYHYDARTPAASPTLAERAVGYPPGRFEIAPVRGARRHDASQ